MITRFIVRQLKWVTLFSSLVKLCHYKSNEKTNLPTLSKKTSPIIQDSILKVAIKKPTRQNSLKSSKMGTTKKLYLLV